MGKNENPIGFFDSGVGGISVLKEAIKQLPNENYIYYGDSKNAPYGTKNIEQVRQLTFEASEFLIKSGAKALVIACNTATSASIDYLREVYSSIPVIGIEPALKPAVELKRKGKIIIMATPMTLAEKKFNELMLNYQKEAEIIMLPCPGLVELIENRIIKGTELESYLSSRFSELSIDDVAAVVLGCTHYPFVKGELSKILGEEIPVIDGSVGTVKYLKKRLEEFDLINSNTEKGEVKVLNSLDNKEIILFSYKLLEMEAKCR